MTSFEDYAGKIIGVVEGQQNPTVTALSLTSATALQDATGAASTVYVNVGPHASGTVAVAIGPDNSTAHAVIPSGDASLAQTIPVALPPSWWIKVTVGGSATIAGAIQVTG